MLMTDVIVKKREGEKLSAEEIKFVVARRFWKMRWLGTVALIFRFC